MSHYTSEPRRKSLSFEKDTEKKLLASRLIVMQNETML